MSDIAGCTFCEHSDPKRQKDGKIRCMRFSKWCNPIGSDVCEAYFERALAQRLNGLNGLNGKARYR